MKASPQVISELSVLGNQEFLDKLAKIKLVLCDIDGTLVETLASEVADEIRGHCERMHNIEAGPRLSIATGRPLGATIPIAEQLHLPAGSPLICWDGASGFLSGDWKPLWMLEMDNSVQQKFLEYVAKGAQVFLQYYRPPSEQPPHGGHVIHAWDQDMHSPQETFQLPTGGDVIWHTDFPKNLDPAIGGMILTEDGSFASRIARELEALKSLTVIEFNHFGQFLIGVHPIGSTKGDATIRLAKHLGLSLDEILAIGDSNNDAEMLQEAGIGIAVAGSTEKARASADYVCSGGAVLGVIEILEHLSAAKR